MYQVWSGYKVISKVKLISFINVSWLVMKLRLLLNTGSANNKPFKDGARYD